MNPFLQFSGQILPTSDLTETFELELVHNNVKYSVLVNRYGPINFLVKINDSEVTTEIRDLENGTLLVTSVEGSQVLISLGPVCKFKNLVKFY